MNEPIISPWLFYALFVVDNVKCALVVSMFICVVVLFLSPMVNDEKDFAKCVKAFCAVFIISGVLMVFTPNSKTITQMIIAKNITISNIEKAGQLTERAVDKIIEKIVKVSEELNKRQGEKQ
jgi:hypothetical protein